MYHITQEMRNMVKIRTRYNELLTAKAKREKRDISRMDVVREAGIAYPTVVQWEGEEGSEVSFDRLHSDTIIRLCLYLGCQLGDLLFIDNEAKDNG